MYQQPFVKECSKIRAHLESIHHNYREKSIMVYEWMDTTLAKIDQFAHRTGSDLPRLVAREVLKGLEGLHDNGWIHANVHVHNIFLSKVDTPNPIIKLGDLGHIMRDGEEFNGEWRPQALPYRAPESWKGSQPSPKIDVWSLGVSLTNWLSKKRIFGCPIELPENVRYMEAFCVAKVIRLCGDIGLPMNLSPFYGGMRMGAAMANGGYTSPRSKKQISVEMETGTLREELENVTPPIEPGCIDFLEYILNINPDQRPSAREALQHPWLQSLPKTPDGSQHSSQTAPVQQQGTPPEPNDSRKEDTQTDAEDHQPDRGHGEQPAREERREGVKGRKIDFPHCRCS
ncbi:kinase-like protein [Cadophora sp. DSE1049]|nr:kinase-like protein [Cadophora sp. DSE1049]